ncbi:MAG: polysaccharide deacetylase family protein [Endomicrobiales bacterium]|nr:polysaccharide deacetylase family protein [Endomicrobiales bacterium]
MENIRYFEMMKMTTAKIIILSTLFLLPVFLHAHGHEYLVSRKNIVEQFKGRIPKAWGEKLPGVKTRLKPELCNGFENRDKRDGGSFDAKTAANGNSISKGFADKNAPYLLTNSESHYKIRVNTNDKVIALTFDACGSKNDGYDEQLINFLVAQKVPATLFINSRWIDKYHKEFNGLVANNLFEIENHGLNHSPASVNGKSQYKIKGTASVGELFDEVEKNALKIEILTGKKPHFYRSGTAYYDDVAVDVIGALGYEIAGFSVLGDAGATYKKEQVKNTLLSAPPGSIVIFHMNHPEGETAEGIIEAIPLLKQQGFKFVTLSAYKLE